MLRNFQKITVSLPQHWRMKVHTCTSQRLITLAVLKHLKVSEIIKVAVAHVSSYILRLYLSPVLHDPMVF